MPIRTQTHRYPAWLSACCAAVALFTAAPASAITIKFQTSTEPAQVYFSGTEHAVAARVFGFNGFGAAGIHNYAGVFDDTFDVVSGGPAVSVELATAGFSANSAGFVHPGFGPSETQSMGFTFSLLSPNIASGPGSVTVNYDVLVQFIGNGQFQSNWSLSSPATQSFNLGALGILDANFFAPAPGQGSPLTGGGPLLRGTFSLRDAVTTVPEPSSMWLMGAAMAGWAGLRKQRFFASTL